MQFTPCWRTCNSAYGQFFKRAATLLNFDNPERYVGGAYIKIGFFVTDDDLRYQDEIHGNLFSQAEKTLEILFSKYLKAYISYKGIQRLEKFLFPYLAVREALLNMPWCIRITAAGYRSRSACMTTR